MPLFVAGHGFGMGVAVVLEPEKALPTLCGGGAGAVGWPGGFGGWWQADRNDNFVLIFLAHNMVERRQFEHGIGFGVFTAPSPSSRPWRRLRTPNSLSLLGIWRTGFGTLEAMNQVGRSGH